MLATLVKDEIEFTYGRPWAVMAVSFALSGHASVVDSHEVKLAVSNIHCTLGPVLTRRECVISNDAEYQIAELIVIFP